MDDYLAHYGILGMHWGIRRYQNKDGTLTEAGKRRNKASSNSKEKRKTEEKKELQRSKKLSEMSDEELRAAINRLQLESQYKNLLVGQVKETEVVSKGRKRVEALKDALNKANTAIEFTASAVTLAVAINAVRQAYGNRKSNEADEKQKKQASSLNALAGATNRMNENLKKNLR